MIIIYHNNSKVIALSNAGSYSIDKAKNLTIVEFLLLLAKEYQNDLLVWCHINLKEQLNITAFDKLFHHHKLLLSYNPSNTNFFDKIIGYIEDSPFININKEVTYPTWQMSGWVGGIQASVMNALAPELRPEKDFTYFLSSLAKKAMPLGLLCYSTPLLLKEEVLIKSNPASLATTYQFVKQHYKVRWLFLLLFNRLVYGHKLDFIPFLNSIFYHKTSFSSDLLDRMEVHSNRNLIKEATIDVIIPTIGRKEYLYDVLCDLRNQTHLPTNVVVVEQNPNPDSISELEFLTSELWPFSIKHIFIHQTGACNARNLALDRVTSEWVFLADDDNRLDKDVVEEIFNHIKKYGVEVVTTKYLQKGENSSNNQVISWPTFGAGNSFMKSILLEKVSFNTAFEFGYGEDADFGMQLRNLGQDVLYVPEPSITHLKAPLGGFRTKPILAWREDKIQPKPSPTIMLFKLLNQTKEQLLGYKTTLFFKYYRKQSIKNPWKYYFHFQKQWEQSVFWAHELNNN